MSALKPESRTGHLASLTEQRLGADFATQLPELRGEDVLLVPRARVLPLITLLRDDPDADLRQLVDISASDRGEGSDGRFSVRYRLRSVRLGYRLSLVVPVGDADPTVDSLTPLYPAADWYERELWDMYGIYPEGHPHLRPLLLYTGFAGHPLRRDYALKKTQPLVPLRSPTREPIVVVAKERP